MGKEMLIVGLAAAGGSYLVKRFGGSIEAKLAEMKVPPVIGSAAVVGTFTVAAFYVVKQLM